MLQYFLLANIYAIVFFGLYAFILKGNKNHAWSRFYLLSSILISISLPWIRIDLSNAMDKNIQTINLPEVILNVSQKPAIQSVQAFLSWELVYLIIVFALIVQLAYRVIALKRFLKAQQLIRKDGFRIGMNTGYGPASFGDVILFPTNEINENILRHEKAHLYLKHHYDKLSLQMLRCFFFPIIAFHLIYKELMTVHEFEADERAGLNKDNYSKTLLAVHFNSKQFYLLQNFFHHPLKRRIMMLYKNKTSGKARISFLIGLSLLSTIGLITVQSCTKEKPEKVYTSVDVTPEFRGGNEALYKYLSDNIKYPKEAKEKNIHGKAIIQFIVTKDGSIDSVVIKRDVAGSGFGEEAKRVIASMPAWKPGLQNGEPVNVYYTLPVTFAMDSSEIPKTRYVN